ncbi:MAG: VOC family protein [Paraburkholderia sp.]|uniref:VOC family protein n=1 Tax=Paraburkholderia sp. TaxID=1926495 RepID=UPI00122774BC|nr:VOC family protein [Paraburkholderia sp.]TAL99183.1 MAG: VOC family protein [Paraburkholderia sp.]
MSTIQSKPAPVGGLQLHNFALAARDLDAMIAWYETVLGFAVSERGRFDAVSADYAMLEAGGMRIELVLRAGEAGRPVDRTAPPGHLNVPGWKALVLETDDLPAATAALVQHDVEIVWANQPVSAYLRSTMIRDPEGNLINIFGRAK